MIILDATTKSLEIDLDEAHASTAMSVSVDFIEFTDTPKGHDVKSQEASTNGTTEVTILTAPASGKQRVVKKIAVFNADTIEHVLTIQKDVSGTEYPEIKYTLGVGDTLVYVDGVGWNVLQGISGGRLMRAPRVFLPGTTDYDPPTGCKAIVVEGVAGGGGGGGTTTAGSNAACGGGGGAGGWFRKYYANPPQNCVMSIGGGGTAGSTSGGNGGNGSNTTFTDGSTLCTANGGQGGTGQSAGTSLAYVAGGAAASTSTNGDINVGGAAGGEACRQSGTVGRSGQGATSYFGGGGSALVAAGTGTTPSSYGAGGGGGLVLNGSSAVAGGAGATGAIVIWEYT